MGSSKRVSAGHTSRQNQKPASIREEASVAPIRRTSFDADLEVATHTTPLIVESMLLTTSLAIQSSRPELTCAAYSGPAEYLSRHIRKIAFTWTIPVY